MLQSHSVSILSSWHCSIMHLPVHSLLSANVLSGSYISRNNGEGEWMGACCCTSNRKKAGNGHFCLQAQLASEIKDWKPLPPTHFFILLFGFFIPPLAGIVRFSILTHFIAEHPEWVTETLMPMGVYASSLYSGDIFQNLNSAFIS